MESIIFAHLESQAGDYGRIPRSDIVNPLPPLKAIPRSPAVNILPSMLVVSDTPERTLKSHHSDIKSEEEEFHHTHPMHAMDAIQPLDCFFGL
jgi:hypothetical protein